MSTRSIYDRQKALEALLYVVKRVGDRYHALKMLYFADKKHLQRYGRQISGHTYAAMEVGPVPVARETMNLIAPFSRGSNLDFLSESDKECLDSAIATYGGLSPTCMWQLGQAESAYQETGRGDVIELEAIVRSLPEGQALLDYWAEEE